MESGISCTAVFRCFKRCHHPLFSSPLGKIRRNRAKPFQWMPACQEPSRQRCRHPEFKRYPAIHSNLRSLSPSKVGNFKLGWCQKFQMPGVHWLIQVGYVLCTKNLGSSPRKGPKKMQDFASLTEHEAIGSTVLYPVSCPAGTTSSPNKI